MFNPHQVKHRGRDIGQFTPRAQVTIAIANRKERDRLWRALLKLGGVTLNGHPEQNVAGILNLSFAGITAEALLAATPEIAVSTGSACTSAGHEPSHVLRAMGCDARRMRGAVRFSLGRFTTREEIDVAIAAVSMAVQRLRALSPFQ